MWEKIQIFSHVIFNAQKPHECRSVEVVAAQFTTLDITTLHSTEYFFFPNDGDEMGVTEKK